MPSKQKAYMILQKLKEKYPKFYMIRDKRSKAYYFTINGQVKKVFINDLNNNKNVFNEYVDLLNIDFTGYKTAPNLTVKIVDKDFEKFDKELLDNPPDLPKDNDADLSKDKTLNTPLPITPFDNDIDITKPSIGSKPVNDVDNVNRDDTNPESSANSGNTSKQPKTTTPKTKKVKVNKNDTQQVRDNPDHKMLDNITPASSSPDAGGVVENLKAQQESNIDAVNPALPPSEQVKRKKVEQVKTINKSLTTEQQDITKNNLNVLRDEVNNKTDISNQGKKEINTLINNIEQNVNTPQDVDVINELAGVMTKELEQGVENATEDIDTKLREFLNTYDPNLVDFSSPDATKQYALMTTHLLKQLSDKLEFFPQVEKGVRKVNKIQAQVNQGKNIIKASDINETEPDNTNNPLIDGIYEKYIDFNGIKYLDVNDHHPSLVVGSFKF